MAEIHIQNNDPGPPIRSAVATPTILPVPMSAAIVVHRVANADTSPLPVPLSFSKMALTARGNFVICSPLNLIVK